MEKDRIKSEKEKAVSKKKEIKIKNRKNIDKTGELYDFDLKYGDIIGVDEAGRGPLAGNVVAAAVKIKNYDESLSEIDDSKKLSEKKREKIYELIMENFYVGIGEATVEEIDRFNILNATFLAMRRAIKDLEKKVGFEKILVDGNRLIKELDREQVTIVKGDSKSLSIAAASIIAKVTRDRKMLEESKKYPEYSFEKHKGYGTKLHIERLKEYGASKIHRKTFLKKILGE